MRLLKARPSEARLVNGPPHSPAPSPRPFRATAGNRRFRNGMRGREKPRASGGGAHTGQIGALRLGGTNFERVRLLTTTGPGLFRLQGEKVATASIRRAWSRRRRPACVVPSGRPSSRSPGEPRCRPCAVVADERLPRQLAPAGGPPGNVGAASVFARGTSGAVMVWFFRAFWSAIENSTPECFAITFMAQSLGCELFANQILRRLPGCAAGFASLLAGSFRPAIGNSISSRLDASCPSLGRGSRSSSLRGSIGFWIGDLSNRPEGRSVTMSQPVGAGGIPMGSARGVFGDELGTVAAKPR